MDHAQDIANLKARYCAASDLSAENETAARVAFENIFADTFSSDYGMAQFADAQAMVDFMCKAIGGGSDWMIHMLHSPRIVVTGDTATGDWTVLVHSMRSGTGEKMEIIGRYSDEFVLTPDGWRISRINFVRQE